MPSNVTRFPVKTSQKIKNRRGKKSVSCEISGRWLQFSEPDIVQSFGTPIWINVMTDVGDEPRKLTTLCVTLEDLEKALEAIKSKKE